MRRYLSLLLVSALVGAGAIAGCGGDTKEKNDYVDAVNKAQTDFASKVSKIGTAISDPKQAETAINSLATEIDGLVKEFNGIEPPDEVKDSHKKLVSVLEEYASALRAQAKDLGSGDVEKLTKAQTALTTATTKVGTDFDKTINEINQKLHD